MVRVYRPGDTVYIIDVEAKVIERIGWYYLVEFEVNGKKHESMHIAEHVHHMKMIDRILRIEEKLELE